MEQKTKNKNKKKTIKKQTQKQIASNALSFAEKKKLYMIMTSGKKRK